MTRAVELTRTGNVQMLEARDVEAVRMMRVWHMAKLTGQSPSQVMEWPVSDLMWGEAIEGYLQAEQAKAVARRHR